MESVQQTKIRDLISSAKIEQALEEMVLWSTVNTYDSDLLNQLTMLKSRLFSTRRQENMGLVTYTDALREQAFITHAVLQLLDKVNTTREGKPNQSVMPDSVSTEDKMLFLASNPDNYGKLQLDKEFVRIFEGLQNGALDFKLYAEFATTSIKLQDAILKYKPRMLHFAGHGSPKGESEAGIYLLNSTGKAQYVSIKALKSTFATFKRHLKKPIQVVVLNACYSEEQAKTIGEYVDFVIGMNDAISDNAAIEFSTAFYRSLALENNVELAFEMGRNLIQLENLEEEDIPVLYVKGKKKDFAF